MDKRLLKPKGKARIIVVDDHPLFREGLVEVINREKDLEVCAEAPDAPEAMKLVASLKPDLVTVDISLEGMNGIELTKQLRQRYAHLFILIVSMHKESLHADRALRAGANGYVMKREDAATILQAIRDVLNGNIYVSKTINAQILQKAAYGNAEKKLAGVETLSDREFEVFSLTGQGFSTRQIADHLTISIKTVETHRERIREKLNLESSSELMQHAIHWFHHESHSR